MFILYLLVNVCAQINLLWKIYDPSTGTATTDQSLTVGQYGKEVRVYPADGSSFKSEFMISGNLPLSPQFPMARINDQYAAFKVGIIDTSGVTLTLAKSTNPYYQFSSNQITFYASPKQCIITPSLDFSTIPYGGTRSLTLDLLSCLPISNIQIQMLYNTITKTIVMTNQQRYASLSVSSLTASIGEKIQVSFTVNSTYYSISSVSLTVIDAVQTNPVPTLSNINTATCSGTSESFKLGCGKSANVYYSYYYQNQLIDLATIKTQLQLQKNGKAYTNIDSYEGYGKITLKDSTQTQITLSGLRSNTQYILISVCEDEISQSQQVSLSFTRCDNKLTITKIILQSYLQFHTVNLRDIVCEIMISKSLKSSQVSTDDGLFCNNVAQSKQNGNKYYQSLTSSQILHNYTLFLYPDYSTSSNISISQIAVNSYQIENIFISTLKPTVPQVNQEFFIATDKYLNFTISLKSDGFIIVGLDLTQSNLPNYIQFHHGMNYNNIPLIQFQKKYLLAKQQQNFYFSLSDKNSYQLMYLLQSDPSDGAQYSSLVVRSFSLLQMQESYKIILILNVFILIFI